MMRCFDPRRKFIVCGLIASLFCMLSLLPLSLKAEITVYPAPAGASGNTTFTVQVRASGGAWTNLFAYDAVVDKASRSHMSLVYFDSDFTENVEVKVTKNSGTIGSAKIRPLSAGITPAVSGNTLTFTMSAPKKVSVEVDNDAYHNLFVFANGEETHPVTASGPGIYYFGPGVHYIGDGTGTLNLTGGDKVYIAGGAILYGSLLVAYASNVTIEGRGILSGSVFDHDVGDNDPKPSMITIGGSTGINVKDIIVLDTVGWTIPVFESDNVTFDNVKIIGWTVNSDGIIPQCSRNVTINDSFIRNNDDCVSIKLAYYAEGFDNTQGSHNIVIQNSTLWTDQGRAILVGPESYSVGDRTYDGITVKNVDILRVNNYNYDWSRGVLAINAGDDVTVKNVTFQDIRVDSISSVTSLFSLTMAPTPFHGSAGSLIRNISFENVSLNMANQKSNVIYGYDTGRVVDGVRFTNFKINNTCVRSAAAGGILTNSYTRNITFTCDGSGDTQAPTVPTDLKADALSSTSVGLTWTASTDNVGVRGYKIYRNDAQVGTSASTSFTDTNLTAGTTYSYSVSAYDAAGNESAKSAAVLVRPSGDTQPPTVPANLRATVSRARTATLNWTASADNVAVAGYNIYRNGIRAGTSIGTSYTSSALARGTHSYAVSAFDASNNESARSPVVYVRILR
ncbi:MAG TPA: glycosyl hydrolase family 28 protein [Syntrophorhabdaceae bacterium]|jgi:hypothetical protein